MYHRRPVPTSRRRRTHKVKRRRRHEWRSPYESLIRGVQSDQRLITWYQRALWSFHRAPFPVQADPDAQDGAMARAFEWFLFDVVLPPSGRTPVEEWIVAESRRQRWASPVIERYLRFTRGEFGIFTVTATTSQMLSLQQLGSDRVVHAVPMDDWPEWTTGEHVAARLFPIDAADRLAPGPEVLELSPGSSVLPRAPHAALQKAAACGALETEVLYGASPAWLTDLSAAGSIVDFIDAFLVTVSSGGVSAEDLRCEVRESNDPGRLWTALLEEIVPLTPEEPPLLGALLSVFWLEVRRQAGASDKTLRKLARKWQQTFFAPQAPVDAARAVTLPFGDEAAWTLSEHEIAMLRALPRAADVRWAGRRRQARVAIQEEGKLPEYPDAILWMEQPSGLVVHAAIVPRNAASSVILRTLVDAMSGQHTGPEVSGGTARRPGVVTVQSQVWATHLSSALAPLEIEATARYIEPEMAELFDRLEAHFAENVSETFGGVRAPVMRYLSRPATTPGDVARLFAAAAAFYRARPWTVLADDRWIDLAWSRPPRSDGAEPQHAIAVVMGHGGQTFGLAVYFNPADLMCLLVGVGVDVLRSDALSVVYDSEAHTDPDLVAEIHEHGWPVAARRALPTAMRMSPDAPPRLVAGDELELAAAALDAVREFVARHATRLRAETLPCRDDVMVEGFGRVHLSLDPAPVAEPPY